MFSLWLDNDDLRKILDLFLKISGPHGYRKLNIVLQNIFFLFRARHIGWISKILCTWEKLSFLTHGYHWERVDFKPNKVFMMPKPNQIATEN